MIALAVMVVGLLVSTTGALAQAPTFIRTLAGPSFASTYAGGVEWDPINSRIVVADSGENTVELYDGTTGSFLFSFGTYGTGNGQFDTPRDIAIDGSANIYVADANNNRIQKFDSAGSFITATPISVGKCSSCLNSPLGVTWDSANNQLLVADTGDSLIKAFDASLNFKWTSPPGTTTLHVFQPRDATRGPEGLVWVSDYSENKVKAFAVTAGGQWTSTPTVVLGDGTKGGTGANEVINPYNAAFSPDGSIVYVSDIGNDRIASWNISNLSHPVWLTPFGGRCAVPCPFPTDAGKFLFLRRVAVETNGNVIGADLEGNQLNVFTPSGALALQIGGVHAPATPPGGFAEAYGVCTGSDGTTYAVDRANQRVEWFDSNGNFKAAGGYRGVGAAKFSWPEACAVAPDGSVWVADTRNARLEHWPANLSIASGIPSFGTKGKGPNQFNYIEGITVDSSGLIWVADTNNNRIQSCSKSGNCAVLPVSGSGALSLPQSIAVSPTDIYVADTGHSRIVEFTPGGSFVTSFSTGLQRPQGIALAPDGTLWVADAGNNAVVHLSADLSTNIGDGFGSFGNGDYQFYAPHSLAVFGNTLYVADTYNNRVQEFDITGA